MREEERESGTVQEDSDLNQALYAWKEKVDAYREAEEKKKKSKSELEAEAQAAEQKREDMLFTLGRKCSRHPSVSSEETIDLTTGGSGGSSGGSGGSSSGSGSNTAHESDISTPSELEYSLTHLKSKHQMIREEEKKRVM